MRPALSIQYSVLSLGFACAIASHAGEDPSLKAFREFAKSLLKEKDLGGPSAYCAKTNYCQVHICSGGKRNDTRILINGNGTVEFDRFRNVQEEMTPLPGVYTGTYPREKWREMLGILANMGADPSKGKQPPAPPPGPLETITELVLSDGRKSVSYYQAGFKSASIDKGFAAPNIIAQRATDTAWAILITPEKARSKNGAVYVSAKIQAKGRQSIQVTWPDSSEPHDCGRATFRWHMNTPEAQQIGYNTENARAIRSNNPELPWTKVSASKSASFPMVFEVPQNTEPGPKAGRIHEIGILVKAGPDTSAIPVTLFSSEVTY